MGSRGDRIGVYIDEDTLIEVQITSYILMVMINSNHMVLQFTLLSTDFRGRYYGLKLGVQIIIRDISHDFFKTIFH